MDSLAHESDLLDGQKPSEYCAVVGFNGADSAFANVLVSLKSLQHRGQESAGIAIYDGNSLNVRKGMGLVSEVFSDSYLENGGSLKGKVGIGHTRYSTAGTKTLENAGPFIVSNSIGYMALSHNGEIVNADPLREDLKKKGMTFLTSSDSEVMLNVLSKEVVENGIQRGLRLAMEKLRGAYSAAVVVNDRLFAIRDPHGFRPLIIGKVGENYIAASESCVLDILGGDLIRDVNPGEVVELTESGPVTLFSVPAKKTAHCMFEYVYFARPDSVIDKIEVYNVRINLGRKLAKEHPVEADIVIPVPDSARAQALGYSNESGIAYGEGLMKNRFSERTFIMPNQKSRTSALRLKLNPIKSAIEGKRIVLVDDSIIRGNTMKHIIKILRRSGASEVHVRIGSPEIIAACYFGVDMKTKKDFIAAGKTDEQIREEIGADSLGYTSIEGLVDSIGMPENNLCLGCITGRYPVSVAGERLTMQTELESY
ncbi:amidophosphoribosyltransferase [uncultured archaeon]|nr:amidophosphoribosyltransferase [uncultured archaeon]